MLSKVLKGAAARQAPAIAFDSANAAERQSPGVPRPENAGGGEIPALLGKIRILEAAVTAARREGFEAGRQQGEQDARNTIAPVLARMNASITELIGMRPELRRRAEKDAVSLSLKIAKRILHRELSIDPGALNALARVVFDRLNRSESWQITVHPQFADAIRDALPSGSGEKARIEVDASCAPGTFLVRYEDGAIDASIDNQLAEINRGLMDRLH